MLEETNAYMPGLSRSNTAKTVKLLQQRLVAAALLLPELRPHYIIAAPLVIEQRTARCT